MLQVCVRTVAILSTLFMIACDRSSDANERPANPPSESQQPIANETGNSEQPGTTGGIPNGGPAPTEPSSGTEPAPQPNNPVSEVIKPDADSCEKDHSKIWLNDICIDVSTSLETVLPSESNSTGGLSAVDAADCRASVRMGKTSAQILISATRAEDLSTPGLFVDSLSLTQSIKEYCFNVGNFIGYVDLLKQKFALDDNQPEIYAKCRNLAVKQVLSFDFEFRKWSETESNALILWPSSPNAGSPLSWKSIISSQNYVGFEAINCGRAIADVWQVKIVATP